MNKTVGIALDYEVGSRDSYIYIVQDGQRECHEVASKVEDIANSIIELAYSNEIYDVYTHAPFAFTSEIRRAINERERNLYSENKIKVEGI